jgi:two-component system sensor histidine kinase HydH
MRVHNSKLKMTLVVVLVASITFLHYHTQMKHHYRHLFYQDIYFLPLILGAFWFGIRGALATSLGITILYVPFILANWTNLSPDDFNRLMAIVLFNIIATILGLLREREWKGQERVEEEQQRLRAAESLAAIGRAISAVTHDMKTPLIAIGGFTRLVQKHHHEGDPCFAKLDIVIKETQRLETMVKDMLDFSKPLELHRTNADIPQLIHEALLVIAAVVEERQVVVESYASSELVPVSLDVNRIKQVIINIIMNAVQASPSGEIVSVKCSQNQNHLIIDIADSGPGIPIEIRENIFVPFFSDKKDGTGLGLAIAKKIVEAHQGHIEIMDNPDRGLTFRISIPRQRGER